MLTLLFCPSTPLSKPLLSIPIKSITTALSLRSRSFSCVAAKQQEKERSRKKRPGKRKEKPPQPSADGDGPAAGAEALMEGGGGGGRIGTYHPSPLPKPPAGFVLDGHGRVLVASSKRIATIVDAQNNLPLECVIRRVFESSQGIECMLLCPVDTPIQILKSTNFNGWSAVNDEEVEAIIPSAAYALAKIHMHLVISGFCYTARGGFCYSEEDIVEFRTDDGEQIDGLPTEGVEVTCFSLDGAHYMIYTPSDPLLFVAVKDKKGLLQIADDCLLSRRQILIERPELTDGGRGTPSTPVSRAAALATLNTRLLVLLRRRFTHREGDHRLCSPRTFPDPLTTSSPSVSDAIPPADQPRDR